jgi:hypothetical protein
MILKNLCFAFGEVIRQATRRHGRACPDHLQDFDFTTVFSLGLDDIMSVALAWNEMDKFIRE